MKTPVSVPSPDPGQPLAPRLDSWKEIAAYVKRDVSTVQRWEKREGMPVHRHLHDKRGSVYAFGSELDAWLHSRGLDLPRQEGDPGAETLADAGGADEPNQAAGTSRRLVLGGVVVLALLAVIYGLIRSTTRGAARPKITSLAVLPLQNLSGDPAQQYFADGMTEALIARLSAIRGLRVISRTSVMQFKEARQSTPEIAKTLNVDAIIEGSVLRSGNRVRITAQLIRGHTDEHIWSGTHDRELRDALALQSELARSIAQEVEVTVTGQERVRLVAARDVSPEVYETYLKGRFALNKNRNKKSVEESIALFQQAIAQDPSFAPAYAGLAAAYSTLSTVFVAGASPPEARPKAIEAAEKAAQLDPELAEAHVLVAAEKQKQWHWAQAEAEYRRALELSPSDAGAHAGFALWFLCQGRTEEALAWMRRARELDPLALTGADLGWILFHAHRYDEAIREVRSALAVTPDSAGALWFLGFALVANGRPEEAIPVLEKTVFVSGRSPGAIGVLIRAYAHAGRRAEALALLRELQRRQQTGYVPAGAFVNAYLGLGDHEQAFAWLERAYQEQSNILQFLRVHPYLDPLRDDPRFKDLLRRVGLN